MKIMYNNGFSRLNEEQEYANFKDKLAKKGLVPVNDMDKIHVYKISGTEKLDELKKDFLEKYSETYKIILARPRFDMTYYKESLKNFGDLISVDEPTDEELYNNFKLNDKLTKDMFYKNNATYIKKQVIKNNVLTEEFDLETFDELFNRLKKENAVYTFRRTSKLSLLTYLLSKDYFSLEAFADCIQMFMQGKNLNKKSIYSAEQDIFQIITKSYTNEEKRIRLFDKLKIVRDIISSLNIELVYSGDLSDISNFDFEYDIKVYRCNMNRLANENSKLLYSSEFKDTYDRIRNPKVKKI